MGLDIVKTSSSAEADDPNWQGYVEFALPNSAPGSGAFRVDQAGNITTSGVAHLNGGSDSSGTAAASTPSFSTGTAAQVSTTQDVMLYINVTTAASLAVAIGPTSSAATVIQAAESSALGVITLRVPKGWYVKLTGTIADLAITAVTC